ncbi:HxlR family transcriptional regulator [bacterium SCN 62-11]|nr:helix-turn-helix transcriptional regulator [Candidatus Eremiobacteraeota bacterium]ODT55635.1 MAG: HxlR family transcriptional regulator [bacterium SCN 62-11]
MSVSYNRDTEECMAVHEVLNLVGDKWSVLIIVHLREGTLRFNELKRRIGGVSQRMLTLALKRLERDGLVLRTLYPEVPPRVEYQLSPLGRELLEPLLQLPLWAEKNRQRQELSRRPAKS